MKVSLQSIRIDVRIDFILLLCIEELMKCGNVKCGKPIDVAYSAVVPVSLWQNQVSCYSQRYGQMAWNAAKYKKKFMTDPFNNNSQFQWFSFNSGRFTTRFFYAPISSQIQCKDLYVQSFKVIPFHYRNGICRSTFSSRRLVIYFRVILEVIVFHVGRT